MTLLTRAVLPVLAYRWARWTYTPARSRDINALQVRMVARILRTPPLPDEAPGAFAKRRNTVASAVARTAGRWGDLWRKRLFRWMEHVQRHPRAWPARALAFQGHAWLADRRAMHANGGRWGLTSGRTATRRLRHVAPRWESGFVAMQEAGPV